MPPLWIRKDTVEELGETDLVLGVVTRANFLGRKLCLDPGDALVLFTDGVSEAENGDGQELSPVQFSERLSKLHGARAEDVTKALEDAVLQHVGDAPLADDVTLVVVSRNA